MASFRGRSRFAFAVAGLALLLGTAGPASAQAVLKVNDNVNFRFGFLLQGWADWAQDPVSQGYSQNLFLRRARVIVAGQVAPGVTFFFETDNPNLGKNKAAGSLGTGLIVQDAFAEWKIADEFAIQGGLILIPLCRNCLQSAAGLLSIDYGSYSFLQIGATATNSSVGRDTGFQAKGYLLDKHLEYRVGAFQGARAPASATNAASNNAFRVAARVMYDVFDTEVGHFYSGTSLGKKKILAIGGGIDTQSSYQAYAADVFFDWPIAGGNGITLQADYIHWDGGTTYTTLLARNSFFAEGGFYFGGPKIMPWLKYETVSASDSVNSAAIDESRWQVGLAWYAAGYNFNIKALYGRIEPKVTSASKSASSQFTIQLQAFYF